MATSAIVAPAWCTVLAVDAAQPWRAAPTRDAGVSITNNGGVGQTDTGGAVDAGAGQPQGRRAMSAVSGCGCRIASPSTPGSSSKLLASLLFAWLLRRRLHRSRRQRRVAGQS